MSAAPIEQVKVIAPTPQVVEAPRAVAAPQPVYTAGSIQAEIVSTFGKHAATALCIAKAESGFQEKVTGPKRWVNGVLHIGNTDGSVDRGIFQINSRWHPEVTNAMAYNAITNIHEAFRISSGGTNWGLWATHTMCGV